MPGVFTGIIERIGTVVEAVHSDQGTSLRLDLGELAEGSRLGDSIAADGICLTLEELAGGVGRFHASLETRRKTTLAAWRAGRAVNLERALKLGDRLGGHLVAGHVDGIGRLLERRREGGSERFTFVLPDDGAVKVVEKGSLAVDGISLTTWNCRGVRASVAVVPHTLARTTLGSLRPGTPVNLEMDPVGRWVERLLRGD